MHNAGRLMMALAAGLALLPLESVLAQRAAQKVRKDSVLRANESMGEEVPDFRGEFGQFRDAELRKHYGRLAELDVLAEIAARQQDGAFQERVEAVRRKEMQRFHSVTIVLNRKLLTPSSGGTP